MLDLTAIPVVDNHCHPVLLTQHMDAIQFRGYCTEATDPVFAEKHVSNTVYYLWLLRQMALFYGCERNEESILSTRNKLSNEALIERLFRAANIDTLVLDPAYPVERVLEERRDGGIIFRARNEHALIFAEQRLERARPLGRTLCRFEIAVIERHRILLKVDEHRLDAVGLGDPAAKARELLVEGPLSRAAGEEQ